MYGKNKSNLLSNVMFILNLRASWGIETTTYYNTRNSIVSVPHFAFSFGPSYACRFGDSLGDCNTKIPDSFAPFNIRNILFPVVLGNIRQLLLCIPRSPCV